jgi:peroxin-4
MSWKIQDLPEKGTAAASHRNATKRLLKEMDVWRAEQVDERGVERLGPVGDEDLLSWEAVINGRGVGGGYESTSPKPPSLPLCCHDRRDICLADAQFR